MPSQVGAGRPHDSRRGGATPCQRCNPKTRGKGQAKAVDPKAHCRNRRSPSTYVICDRGPSCAYHRRQRRRCRLKLQRIISLATLAISIFTLILVLRRPAPVAAPVSPAVTAANAQSFQEKVNRLAEPRAPGEGESEVRMNSGELTAALAQATGMLPTAGTTSAEPSNGPANSPSSSGSMEFPGAVPNIKDYQVSMDGDIIRGQFLTQIAGKDVYLTLAGHLGSRDGYATFDATEVKVGDLSVPASLVNEVLQKKLAEQRDQLKLPNNVKDIKVENGELVFVEK